MQETARIKEDVYQRVKNNLVTLAYGVLDFEDRITPNFVVICFDRWTEAIFCTTAHQRENDGETELAIDTVACVARPIEDIPGILADHYEDDSLICDSRLFETLRTHPQVTVLEENEGTLKIGTLNGILSVFTPIHPILNSNRRRYIA